MASLGGGSGLFERLIRVHIEGWREANLTELYHELATRVKAWREAGYPSDDYPVIGEILDWAMEPEVGHPRFLRKPQITALETYWYLRIVEGTPHILELYRGLYSPEEDLPGLVGALGVSDAAFKAANYDLNRLLDRVRSDDSFVHDFKLETLRETLTLAYPSYILALAMGAGKTILIGAIIGSEFSMALEYPNGPFVENALVFAPGKTIIESLRELAEIPYEKVLPPRLYRAFSASVKLTFTRDGDRDVPVVRGSAFNIVVTNTEKIRIQKESIRKSDLGPLFPAQREDEARQEVANLRLQTIASLPHLAVFSDEAHHTYGQAMDSDLKKVRKTVDYLAGQTNVVCVVNTTGTPYFMRQPLKDVVVWYGLSEGIRDGILKDLAGNIQAYDFSDDAAAYVAHVITDFFREYGDVRLPNGAPAKLALYFPQNDDLKALRPVIDQALIGVGLGPAVALVNTSDETLTKQADIDAFNRLNDPAAPHRVILLVNKGTEGWNCPSLFACALVRRLRTSNNFVLQAATRCLRQVPGNDRRARVYLSKDNFNILDRQLQETYGETIAALNHAGRESRRARIVLRKLDLPPVVVTQLVRTVVRAEWPPDNALRLQLPEAGDQQLTRTTYTIEEQQSSYRLLRAVGEAVEIEGVPDVTDAYAASVELAAKYWMDPWTIYDALRGLYGDDDIPGGHVPGLAGQIEQQTRAYEIREERVDKALALVKPEGFTADVDDSGAVIYTAEIVYPVDRERLLLPFAALQSKNRLDLGFHYSPYDFDSNPELDFFEQLLIELNTARGEVDDIYFTGAVTDPGRTDFFVEYKDDKGKWRRYTPDFVVRRKDGRTLIVEVKAERDRAHPVNGENGRKALALRSWEGLNPDRLKYQMVFTAGDTVAADQVRLARDFTAGNEGAA